MDGELQDMARFAVQVLDRDHARIFGTAFLVSPHGAVVTCRHVVERVLGDELALGAEVGIRRPPVSRMDEFKAIATVTALPEEPWRDDVALLALMGEWNFTEADYAHLGPADRPMTREAVEFQSYGFPDLGPMSGGDWNEGKLRRAVGAPDGERWSRDPVQLLTEHGIRPGSSGSPVLAFDTNHIVGLLFGTFEKAEEGVVADRGYVVNAAALAEGPFRLSLEKEPWVIPYRSELDEHELEAGRDSAAGASATRSPSTRPAAPGDWVGRTGQLAALSRQWKERENVRIQGIVGLGGEGKTGLVAHWVDHIVGGEGAERPADVFWWTFDTADVEHFLEEAVAFIGTDPTEVRLPRERAKRVVAAARTRRYVFVLDGVEVLQRQGRERYGEFESQELAHFLALFAREAEASLAIITSRAPLADLRTHRAYRELKLGGLSDNDGIELLRKLGVVGSDEELRVLVDRVGGHALTLSLLGTYLRTRFEGRILDVDEVVARASAGEQADGVRLLLDRYDSVLSDTERSVASVLATLRKPLEAKNLDRLLAAGEELGDAAWPLSGANASDLSEAADHLVELNIAQDQGGGAGERYLVHPIVRSYYADRLAADGDARRAVHRALTRFWLGLAEKPRLPATLARLSPAIEAVHHASEAEDFREAFEIYSTQIDQIEGERGVLAYQLGAYSTDLALVLEFFPHGDFSQPPLLEDPGDAEYVVRSVGLGLMTVGRLQAAFPICRRSREMATEANDWLNASKAYQLIAELQIHLGRFGDAEQTSRDARASAARLGGDEEGLEEQACSLAYEAWAAHLLGDLDNADSLFAQAEEIRPVASPDEAELTDLWGIYYAEHLALTGRAADAIERLNNNMRISEESLPEVVSQCHRVLGDIELEAHGPSSTLAEAHYSEAVKIATAIWHRAILIEALLGRGRLSAVRGDLQQAQADLFKALDLAHASGYAMYEADAHWTLALAYLTSEEFEFGRVAAQRGAGASEVIGYQWGIERTNEILSRIPAQV